VGRPGVATTAGVLGFVTGGLTALMSVIFLILVVGGDTSGPDLVLLLGLPCAAGLIAGASILMRRGSSTTLFGSALASVGVLVLTWLTGVASLDAQSLFGLTMFLVLALPLPVLTAVFARMRITVGWTEAL
jgi:hypothetical protein